MCLRAQTKLWACAYLYVRVIPLGENDKRAFVSFRVCGSVCVFMSLPYVLVQRKPRQYDLIRAQSSFEPDTANVKA